MDTGVVIFSLDLFWINEIIIFFFLRSFLTYFMLRSKQIKRTVWNIGLGK